jgi:hypothetical protein
MIVKSLDDFSKNRSKKDGLQGKCKQCVNKYRKQNIQKEKERSRRYREKNKEILKEKKKVYYERNKIRISEKSKVYRTENTQKIKDRKKKYYVVNKDQYAESSRLYRENNKEKKAKMDKDWKRNNKERFNKQIRERKKTDIGFRLTCDLRTRLWQVIKGSQKTGSAIQDLGCSVPELKQWFEQQFYPHPVTGEEMTWENWGRTGWHIDHIIPLSSFDLTDRKQFLKANHWFNLRPLWAEENYAKIKSDLRMAMGNEGLLMSSPYRR